MPRKPRYTIAQVKDALERADGVRKQAARYLGCSRETVDRYVRKHPELNDRLHGITEELVDLAETQLHRQVREGKWAAIKFVLETKGAERGWVTKRETSGEMTITTLDGRSDAELDAIIAATEGVSERDTGR